MDPASILNNEFIADYSKLFDERDNTADVEIIISGTEKKILAHSLVLSIRSDYFKQSLSDKWAKMNNDGKFTLTLSDIEYDTMIILLKYLYYADANIFDHDDFYALSKVLIASDKLNMVTFSDLTQKTISKKILIFIDKNLFDLFKFIMDYQMFTFIDEAFMCEIAKNPDLLFSSKDFIKLDEKMLQKIILCNALRISEFKICEYLIEWSNVENNETKFNSLFNLIRFHQMKKEDFFYFWTNYRNKITISDNLLNDIIGFFMCNNPQNIKQSPFRLGNYQRSEIIKYPEEFLEISSWIDNDKGKSSFRFDLIFDNSFFGDKFNTNSFHKICDGTFSTITLVVLDKCIVGGYNPIGWSNDNKWQKCKSSFIFAYNHNNNATISGITEKERAIGCFKNRGPCFGEGSDLCIRHDSNKIELNPKSYPKLFDLNGNYFFRRMEIFRVNRIYDL
ncbi:25970_t:CDS:1 [Racocetra persica]|uniref:25970_t:CDS:1 n=1 Tax=Racocetra persica TaxID=160502 RepID=A0ACA9MF44_9GLOM|nr:25970_t:CDS:1 [Racocetra persica]